VGYPAVQLDHHAVRLVGHVLVLVLAGAGHPELPRSDR
jgi:hypothetical protein